MSFEAYNQVMTELYECIRPKNSVTYTFYGDGNENAKRLFLTGETNISPTWKTEPDYQMLYRRIDDSLRSDIANRDRFCLDFSGGRCEYPKIAFKKLVTPLRTPMFVLDDCTDNWHFGIFAKAQNLKIYGYLRICVEVRLKKEGISKFSTVEEPDSIFTIDIPKGSYNWQKFEKNIVIDLKNTANVCYYVEGEDYEGEVYFESPQFASENQINILGQFLPHSEDRPCVNWMGQNLSRIEWIGLRVDINDKTVFDGEVFERCHRFSEAEIALPENAIHSGENTITFTCTSDYRDAAGYVLREWGFITERESFVVAAPENVTAGKEFFVCVEGKKGDKITLDSSLVSLTCEPKLKNDGLNALSLVCNTPCNGFSFALNGENITVSRCVLREDDGVLTGTGDLLYIPVKEQSVTNYLKWYLSNHIGNLLTIRPTYRWNGTRLPEPGLYKKIADFLDSMGIYYSHMLDGRELPGCNGNPTVAEINNEHFLGRQTHELDGAFYYWGIRDVTNNLSEQMFYDLFIRMNRKYSERMHNRYIPENINYTDNKQYIFSSPDMPDDMQGCAELFLKKLKTTGNGNMRHTGPSTLFKYFYQAGYNWVGAELMYSPTEITVAALRGANRVYGGKMGAHHAVQWSTQPHDTVSRYRRYRLALFICYMQGIDEINTEEGLWRLEEYYNFHHRFTPACENHTVQQQDFYRYISTHTRRGEFYTPIAFLSGRYDGWRCFGRKNTWGNRKFGYGDAEKSWDILRFYYPKSILDSLYRHNCPDEEIGYYSGTPNGNVDIIPIEAEDFSKYRLLIASGYNKAESEDMEKLKAYVMQGGILLLGWPQLSVTVDRNQILSYDHTYLDGKERVFVEDTYCSYPVRVCEAPDYDSVLLYTDSKRPLVTVKKVGAGYVYFVNAREYAGTKAVELAYREVLSQLTADCLKKETIYAKGDRNIQFTVFENNNKSRDIYFIATDWHKEIPDGVGKVILNNTEYDIPVSWGQLVKVSAYGDSAIYSERDENEVLFFDGSLAKVQGTGIAKFILCKNGENREITVDFTNSSVQEFKI
jgi:hypothetical protein